MPENKNQSARWPSVGGSSVTGRVNLQGYNPEERRRALIADLRKQKFAGEMSLNDQLARIQQNIAAGSITAQERLMASRQANIDRMTQLYGNYFQQFGNVLNKEALDFLDKHSKISVPTLTAIMAGYEHARASRAEQELAMLDRQAKLMQSAEVLETERAKLAEEKARNDTAVLQSNIAQAAKSYSDYMGGLISDVGGGTGRAGGRGTGGAGMAGGSAAKGYDEGGANVVGGARTGTPGSSGQQSASASEGAVDTKAEQTGVQGIQYGPNTQQAVDIDNQITELNDLANTGNFAISSIASPIVGKALTAYGSRASLGYVKPSEWQKFVSAGEDLGWANRSFNQAKLEYNVSKSMFENSAKIDPRFARAGGDLDRYTRMIENRDALRTRLANKGLTGTLTLREQRVLTSLTPTVTELDALADLQNMKKAKSSYDTATLVQSASQSQFRKATTNNIVNAANTGRFARYRGATARGVGKFASKVLGPASWVLTVADLADEAYGGGAAVGRWLRNTGEDLLGVTRERLRENPNYLEERITPGQEFNRRRNAFMAGENILLNRISGGRWNFGLGNDIANMTIGRLRELGYEPNRDEISQIIMNINNNPQDSANALEFLMSAQSDGNGNIAGTSDSIIKYYNDVLRDSAFQRTYAAQANKIAQDRQISEQQMMQEQRNAMLAEGLSRTEQGIAQQIYDYAAANGEEVDFEDILAVAHLFHDEVMVGESGGRHGIEGDMTSDGTAKSAYQLKDKTFQWFQKALLQDDDRSGGQLLNPQQREVLRAAKNANDLDRDEVGQSVLRAFPLYHLWKENINIGKFGKGNPNISAIDAFVEVAKIHRNMGRQGNPYVIGNLDALRRAVHGRFFDTEENRKAVANMDLRLQNNFQTPQGWWSQRNGAFMMSNDVNAAMRGRETSKNNSEYNLGNVLTGQIGKGESGKYFYYENFPNLRGYSYANIDGLIPEFTDRLGNFSNWYKENIGEEIYGSSAYRSKDHQAKVKAIQGKSAADPGYSNHGSGSAFDADWERMLKRTKTVVKNNPELLIKYGANDAADLLDKVMGQYGLERNLKHRSDEQHHIEPIRNDRWNTVVNIELLDDHRKKGLLGTESGNFYMRKQQPALSVPQFKQYMIPIESTYSEPPPQTVVAQNPWGVDFLDQYIGQNVAPGGATYSPTYWGVAMQQMNQQPQEGFYIDPSMIIQ